MFGPTVYDQLLAVADAAPDAPFQVHAGRRWTWAQARDDVDALARGLLRLGVRRGDTVAIWLPNVGEWSLIWLAAASIGAAAVPVNTRYKADEAGYVIGHSDATVLFYAPEFLGIDFRKIVSQIEGTALRHVVALTDDQAPDEIAYRSLLEPPGSQADADLPAARAAVEPSDDLILVYTSGTTGFPKGARHNHETLSDVAAMADVMGVGPGDSILTVLPFFHVGGSFMSTMTVLVTGASMVLVESFTGAAALELVERERCTVVNGVPSHFVMMLTAIEDGSVSPISRVRGSGSSPGR